MPVLEYGAFLYSKKAVRSDFGVEVQEKSISPVLHPFQRAIVLWALRKGRAAVFADCGLGKTLIQLEWARHQKGRTLILAPLCVSEQTIIEASEKLRMAVTRDLASEESWHITNYEQLHRVDAAKYGAVVLDESSILKGLDGKTRQKLVDMFGATPARLCCTATPAPNDIVELANHCEFLSVMRRVEMLATWFVHDEDGWRLKGHAKRDFFRWLASWGVFLNHPSDIGFEQAGYALPELRIHDVVVDTPRRESDVGLFPGMSIGGIGGRLSVRRDFLEERVARAVELLSGNPHQWLVWVGLNDEGRRLHAALNGSSVLVEGTDTFEQKREAIGRFLNRDIRVLVTKPRIAGFGMNFQQASRMLFLGLGDSWEQYYHSIRRCWRYGQERPVDAYVVVTDRERVIVENVRRKEGQARMLTEKTVEHVRLFEREELMGGKKKKSESMERAEISGKGYDLYLGDCIDVLSGRPEASVDFSVYSPPFQSLYTYTDSPRDLGNSRSAAEFFTHFDFFTKAMLRVTKPGRLTACHVAQVPAMIVRDGYIGMKDFRGRTITAFEQAGWIYVGEACVDKNPQAQAIRTKAKALLFKQLGKDAAWLRPGLADFLLLFRKPGENAMPIIPDIDNETWITWAHPVWYDIREGDTLRYFPAKGEEDERHICPLQLGLIERAIRLWSNRGEVVLSPFMGIGSEGVVAVRLGRRFLGVELKGSYYRLAERNVRKAATALVQRSILGDIDLTAVSGARVIRRKK